MFGKTALAAVVYLVVARPWPAAELGLVVVFKRLLYLFFGVHYNGGISSFRIVVPAVTVGVEFDHLQYGRKCL